MAATSVLSLMLVPILVNSYGLHTYGLIPLLRLLTPLGLLGLLLLGLPSLAARTSAAPGTPAEAVRAQQSTLVAACLLLGTALSLALAAIGWRTLAEGFAIETADRRAFATGFYALLCCLPVLFAGGLLNSTLIARGQLKALRSSDVATSLLYFLVCVGAVWANAPIEVVLLALLATDVTRALVLAIYAMWTGLLRPSLIVRCDWRWLFAQGADLRTLTVATLSGYSRKYAASTTVAVLFGPAALGLYDAVERVPRAFKTLLGLVNTAVLPHTLALDGHATMGQLRSLFVRGIQLTLFFTLPASICVMFYASPLLAVWLGPELRHAGPLLTLLMIPNTLETILSIFSTASITRLPLVRLQNAINALEIVGIVGLTLLLSTWLDQTAAYAALALVAGVGYTLRLDAFLRNYEIPRAMWRRLTGKTFGGAIVGNGLLYIIARSIDSSDLTVLLTAPAALLLGTAMIFVLWNKTERRDLGVVYSSLRRFVSR